MLKNYIEILDIREKGLCDSCDHGINKCLAAGKAYCKTDEKKQEESKDEEKPI